MRKAVNELPLVTPPRRKHSAEQPNRRKYFFFRRIWTFFTLEDVLLPSQSILLGQHNPITNGIIVRFAPFPRPYSHLMGVIHHSTEAVRSGFVCVLLLLLLFLICHRISPLLLRPKTYTCFERLQGTGSISIFHMLNKIKQKKIPLPAEAEAATQQTKRSS